MAHTQSSLSLQTLGIVTQIIPSVCNTYVLSVLPAFAYLHLPSRDVHFWKVFMTAIDSCIDTPTCWVLFGHNRLLHKYPLPAGFSLATIDTCIGTPACWVLLHHHRYLHRHPYLLGSMLSAIIPYCDHFV